MQQLERKNISKKKNKLHFCFFLLTVAFHLILTMGYEQAETFNKIMYSIIVAILFAIRIYSNSTYFLPRHCLCFNTFLRRLD